MRIDEQPIVFVGDVITWRSGSDFVFATVGDKSVALKSDWPCPEKWEEAASHRLAINFPDQAEAIWSDLKALRDARR